MKRRIYILLLMFALSFSASAQVHRVGFAVFGGANTLFADTALTNKWGPMAGAELYYACMFSVNHSQLMLGPRTGIEIGWSNTGFEMPISEQFSNTDYLGHQIDYTISGSVKENYNHLSVAVPLMLALKYRGFVFGAGVKARAMLWNTAKTSISHITTTAYYPEFDVMVQDEPNIGVVQDMNYDLSGSRPTPEWHVALAAEIGYEWQLRKTRWMGFRIFADYDVWNSFKQPADAEPRVVSVSPITETNKVAQVTLAPIYNAALTKFKALNIGVALTFTFDFIDDNHHCNCLPY